MVSREKSLTTVSQHRIANSDYVSSKEQLGSETGRFGMSLKALSILRLVNLRSCT